ncbi:unnamed protein product [Acanthoscelides obtectus]|uniref:Uncharacterized protein n=1 Tax=Acanthoscelides obtectus TaxID=200917 RepID=A0A9P0K258_ACAOB|nr:unnamed protein product [Acanthoscelides obtectus]CAK1632653.1 hypothetical protein AOBTE_LOCUS7662 [Acanthoscelides obtectus]
MRLYTSSSVWTPQKVNLEF